MDVETKRAEDAAAAKEAEKKAAQDRAEKRMRAQQRKAMRAAAQQRVRNWCASHLQHCVQPCDQQLVASQIEADLRTLFGG